MVYHSEISGHWEQRKDKISSPNQQILHRRLRIRTVLDNRLVPSKFWEKKFLTNILKNCNYLKKVLYPYKLSSNCEAKVWVKSFKDLKSGVNHENQNQINLFYSLSHIFFSPQKGKWYVHQNEVHQERHAFIFDPGKRKSNAEVRQKESLG